MSETGKHRVHIKDAFMVTHDVKSFILERPAGFDFEPGQAAEIFIDKPGWEEEGRPFTFTGLPGDPHLQFIIKTYPERKGVTNELLSLGKGDTLIIQDVFGAIAYRGEGTFIAGGAGVTPFIAIFRHLKRQGRVGDNRLIFANKTRKDIILENEFREVLGENFINILSDEEVEGYAHGFINSDLIEEHMKGREAPFYLCGPPPMMDAVLKQLAELGVGENSVVVEV